MKRELYSDGSIGYEYEKGDWITVPVEMQWGSLSLVVEAGTRGRVIRAEGPVDKLLVRYEGGDSMFFCNFTCMPWDVRPCTFQSSHK